MDPDDKKVDDVVIALMYMTLHEDNRVWKGFPWDATNRLHERGLISNPIGKAKSVVLTEKGIAEAEKQFKALLAEKQ